LYGEKPVSGFIRWGLTITLSGYLGGWSDPAFAFRHSTGLTPRRRPRHAGQDRLPHIPRDRYHRLSRSWGTLENARAMAAHESQRTTKLYDHTGDEITIQM
jgi:hypothetical protein